uniref:DUF6598 domain-containing protein n=1 Tax=Oryza punctata TaxID=4537 RepID=A0A0E0MK74_ORYPU
MLSSGFIIFGAYRLYSSHRSRLRGPASSQDKVLSCHAFVYGYLSDNGFARREVESTEHSTMEFTFAQLTYAVEETIIIHVVQGSTNFKACFAAGLTADIDEDVVLLDSGYGMVAIDDDGLVMLRRRVVVKNEGNSR